MTHQGLSDATLLFAESPTRFLVEVAQEDAATFEAILGKTPHARIGVVLAQPQFRATSDRGTVIDADITRLRTCWLTPLAEAAI